MTLTFDNNKAQFTLGFAEMTVIGGEEYSGSYTVTPSFQAQTLSTKNLSMTDDVTINAITYPVADYKVEGEKLIVSNGLIIGGNE